MFVFGLIFSLRFGFGGFLSWFLFWFDVVLLLFCYCSA